MSAFGTKKPNGDRGVQLTFPLNFQKAYDLPFQYFPSDMGGGMDIMIGTDFQSEYHAQKRAEANKSVMDGIQANRTKEQKLLTGVANYHLPKAVLGQRIYANPMNGAETIYPTRRDNGKLAPFKTIEVGKEGSGSMRGGVVVSLEAQEFYKKQLDRRIAQLNRMNALAQGYAVQLGQQFKTEDNTKTGSVNKVEFFIYLRSLMNAITEGNLSTFTFENLKEMIDLMFKFGPTMSVEDIDDSRHALDQMIISAGYLTDIPANQHAGRSKKDYAITLSIFVKKMRQYIGSLEANINLSERDKKTLSASLRRDLGFEKLLRFNSATGVVDEERRVDPRVNQEAEDDDDDDGDDARFDRPAENREDGEARGIARAPLAGRNEDENRARFGRRTGVFTYGAPTWFGETEDVRADEYEDLAPRYVAPLGLAGADPNAERAPRANPEVIREALEEVVRLVLEPLGYTRDQDESEFISSNYPDPENFVREVVSNMEERGFSKAQIAEGMSRLDLEVFNPFIEENTGDTAPAPLASSASSRFGLMPMGGLGPALYRDDDDDGQADVVDASETATTTTNVASSASARAYPSEAQRAKLYRDHNLPKTRDEMYSRFITEADYRALGARIPAEYGGPYNVRSGTAVKNAKQRIIKIFKQYIDPRW